MKSVGDASAQEILECIVDCLVSERRVTFQYFFILGERNLNSLHSVYLFQLTSCLQLISKLFFELDWVLIILTIFILELTRVWGIFLGCVKYLNYTFPNNLMTSWCAPFWFSPNHFPNALEFNSNDPNNTLLIVAKSVLWSNTYGIPIPKWDSNSKYLAEAFDIMQILVFNPKKVVILR